MPFKNNKGVHRQSFVRSIHTALGISVQTSCSVGSASPTAMGQCGTFDRRMSGVVGLQNSCGGLTGWENHAGYLLLTHFSCQTHCLQSTHPALGHCAGYLWGFFNPCWDPCRTFWRSSAPQLTPIVPLLHRDLHKPLVLAWKRAQPSVVVSSLIS